jgi:transcriptional regulator with XRE-family HTH domain
MPSSAPDVSTEIDVGERLRAIRRARRCTLRTVAMRSGLSESFLSQVERGRSSASIASLRRIADALGVSIADLFDVDSIPGPRVLRRDARPALVFGVLGRKLLLTPRPPPHCRPSAASRCRSSFLRSCRRSSSLSRLHSMSTPSRRSSSARA